MRLRAWAKAGAGVLAWGLLMGQGCPGSSPPPPVEEPLDVAAIVTTSGSVFSPGMVTIQAGQAVRWVNDDSMFHTVTSGDPSDRDKGDLFESGELAPGDQFERAFPEPGVYAYHCRLHTSTMWNVTVVVE